MKRKLTKPILHKYVSSDIATVICDSFAGLESPEGDKFYAVQPVDSTAFVSCGDQVFIVSVVEQTRLS